MRHENLSPGNCPERERGISTNLAHLSTLPDVVSSHALRRGGVFGCLRISCIRSPACFVKGAKAAQAPGQTGGGRRTREEQNIMNRIRFLCATAIVAFGTAFAGNAIANPMVGGAPMFQAKNIIENAMNSKDHTTLVAAVKAGGLVDTLEGTGPFTVFAPTNEAFAALPAGTVDSLLKPENKSTLDKILTYHVVAGKLDSGTIDKEIMAGGGKTQLKTVQGETLWVSGAGKNLTITDAHGNMANVTIADVYQSNGVILVVDKVLMPN